MRIIIEYKARITWTDTETFELKRDMCDVVHGIDTETLSTVSFDWTPVYKPPVES